MLSSRRAKYRIQASSICGFDDGREDEKKVNPGRRKYIDEDEANEVGMKRVQYQQLFPRSRLERGLRTEERGN